MNEHRIKIGNSIAELRAKKGISQNELAEITGLQQANICRIEKGKYNVSIDILQKVCDALDANIKIE